MSSQIQKIKRFDEYILLIMKKHIERRSLDLFMTMITSLGDLGIVWILISAYLLTNSTYRPAGIAVIETLILGTILGEGLLKHVFRRHRPSCVEDKLKLMFSKPITYSFPSGHALSSFAAAETLSIYFSSYRLIFFSIALLIAFSRIYLNVHYPTDVFAGIVIGLLCSRFMFFVFNHEFIQKLEVVSRNLF